jgi:hypothetical protein
VNHVHEPLPTEPSAAPRWRRLGALAWPWLIVVAAVAAFAPLATLTRKSVAPEAPPASVPVAPPAGRNFYVSPSGTPDNPGTAEAPLDLQTALSDRSPAAPGDTIWMLGGTYRGTYTSTLRGTPDAPIVVRQMPGHRATIDAVTGKDGLFVNGEWTWYWGFEIFSSHPNRISTVPGATDIIRGGGVVGHAPGARYINLVIHDMQGGMGIWASSPDAEIYGNLIYHNGYLAPDRGHGHGIYAQNRDGRQHYVDNILFGGFSHGFHIYGSDQAYLNNIHLEGNVAFNSGILGPLFSRNILFGGGRVAENPTLIGNYTYFDDTLEHPGGENALGYHAGCRNLVARHNYFAHIRKYPLVISGCDGIIERNLFIGWADEATRAPHPRNTFLPGAPEETHVFVRPNKYERGRSNVIVYNWQNHPSVEVDLTSTGLKPGEPYEVRDAQNFFGAPVAAGIFTGAPVPIPMTNTEVARPVGNVPRQPKHTPRVFGVFIVLPRTTGS